jgi:RNA polymerase sigma-70 factor (ECF subfamily)
LLALDRLSPMERAAFLLHDVFDTPFAEIAAMLDRSEASCRQLATRARRAVRDERPAPAAAPDNHARLLMAFSEAVSSGNVARLAELLREDAVAITDGGGRKTAALNPIYGADKIARFFVGLAAKNPGHELRVEPAMINGAYGALVYVDGEFDHTFSMAIDGNRIAAIYLVRNPDKLRHLPIAIRH